MRDPRFSFEYFADARFCLDIARVTAKWAPGPSVFSDLLLRLRPPLYILTFPYSWPSFVRHYPLITLEILYSYFGISEAVKSCHQNADNAEHYA
jgi:hypothetical protein